MFNVPKVIRYKKEIRAIGDLVIQARTMAYQKKSLDKIAGFLDDLEFLPTLLVEENVDSKLFETYLQDICANYECLNVLNRYRL